MTSMALAVRSPGANARANDSADLKEKENETKVAVNDVFNLSAVRSNANEGCATNAS